MGTWFNNDGLFIEYGVTKAVPTTAGDYRYDGPVRVIELTIDLTTLTTSPVIQDNVTFYGTSMFVEKVEVDTEVAGTTGTSFSVGLVALDRSTVISNTAFLAAAPLADHDAVGEYKVYTPGVTGSGAYVGTTSPNVGYITALAAGTYGTGRVKVRIYYRGYGTITQ